MDSNGVSDIDPLVFQTKGIVSLLRNINAKKASGPDGISCFVLKEAAEEIAAFLQFIFNQSLTTGQVPGDWKCANVTPVFKKGSKKEACDYRLVSLTSVPCKISGAHYLPSYYGSVGRASCTCQLPAWISPGPLMWKPANYNSRTYSQKLRPRKTDWCIIAGLLKGIWYGPAQTSPQEIRSLRNPWTTDQTDRILALRKNSESCC